MDYMFLIYGNEAEIAQKSPEARAASRAKTWVVLDDAQRRGVLKGARPLKPTATAVTVRGGGDNLSITDGPFAETKEVLGGYWIIECADLNEAKEWGARISSSGCANSVEIREIAEIPVRDYAREDVEHANAINA